MTAPASAVGFVFSGALINVQSLESVAFSFSYSTRVQLVGRCAVVNFWT
jgi:hypothetical protein